MAKIAFAFEAVEFGVLDQGVEGRSAFAAIVGASEQIIFPADGNLAVILPASGRISSPTIPGILGVDQIGFVSQKALSI